MPNLIVVEDHIPWFGAHTGYERLVDHLPDDLRRAVLRPGTGNWSRLRGKLFSMRHGIGPAPQGHVHAVAQLGRELSRDPRAVGHILYGDHFLDYFVHLPAGARERSVLTLHQPRAVWTGPRLAALRDVPHRIFLFSPAPADFPDHPDGWTTRILHGVDITFFRPAPHAPERRVLFSGVHLRNVEMLEAVAAEMLRRDPTVVFDMLVPTARRNLPAFENLLGRDNICWHANLSDVQLRSLYWRAAVMFLPLHDSGANTAVVEALACGLPIVTTDVGGIRDYGGGVVFPLVANHDVGSALELISGLLDDSVARSRQAAAQRAFAVANLDWAKIAREHVAAYARLAGSTAAESRRSGAPAHDG